MNRMGLIRRYWPYKTRHGWIVGVSAIDTDACPTFVASEQAAEEWADRLNANERGAVEAERQRIAALVRDKAEGTWDPTVETVLRALVHEITTAGGQ